MEVISLQGDGGIVQGNLTFDIIIVISSDLCSRKINLSQEINIGTIIASILTTGSSLTRGGTDEYANK